MVEVTCAEDDDIEVSEMEEEAEDEAIAEVGDVEAEDEEVEVTCAEDDDTEVSEMEEEEEVDLRLW